MYIVIRELKSNKGNVIEETNTILIKIITYYQKLYTTQHISSAKMDEYVKEINIQILKESDTRGPQALTVT